jgi:hypothetical protein
LGVGKDGEGRCSGIVGIVGCLRLWSEGRFKKFQCR